VILFPSQDNKMANGNLDYEIKLPSGAGSVLVNDDHENLDYIKLPSGIGSAGSVLVNHSNGKLEWFNESSFLKNTFAFVQEKIPFKCNMPNDEYKLKMLISNMQRISYVPLIKDILKIVFDYL
jgi:hypothetical protein